jgi:hypothetical protein
MPEAPKELREFRDSLYEYPESIRDNVWEDVILDQMIATTFDQPVETMADAVLTIHSQLWKWITKTDATVASGIESRLATKLFYVSKGVEPDDTGKLATLLKKRARVDQEGRGPILILSHIKGVRILTVRIPVFIDGPTKDGFENNLAAILTWTARVLGLQRDQVRLVPDQTLGDRCGLPAPISSLMEAMKLSLESRDARFAGNVFNFASGFKGNLLHILSAMFALRKYEDLITRPVKILASDKITKPVTISDLMDTFNSETGLKKSSDAYSATLFKSTLSLLTRASNENFPGNWMYSAKELNKVKSNEGLINSLGWDLCVPSWFKEKKVLFTDCFKSTDNKCIIRPVDEKNYPSGFGWKEFRTGVLLSLPLYDSLSTKGIEDQLRGSDLAPRRPEVLRFLKRNHRLVALMNKSFAALTALSMKNTKTDPRFYEALRNKLLAETANIPFTDARGNQYVSARNLPKNYLEWAQKFFRYKIPELKRDRSPTPVPPTDAPPATETSMDIDESPTTPSKPTQAKRMLRPRKTVIQQSTPKASSARKKAEEKAPLPKEPTSKKPRVGATEGSSGWGLRPSTRTFVPKPDEKIEFRKWMARHVPTTTNKARLVDNLACAVISLRKGSEEFAIRDVMTLARSQGMRFIEAASHYVDTLRLKAESGVYSLRHEEKRNEVDATENAPWTEEQPWFQEVRDRIVRG